MASRESARRTYYVVQSFSKSAGGRTMDPPLEARTEEAALRAAERLSQRKASVIVFGRTGNPDNGEFDEPVILASYGEAEELPF